MKAINLIKYSAVAIAIGIFSFSCSKKDGGEPQPAAPVLSDQEKITKTLQNLKFSFSEPGSGNINFNPANNTFNYIEPTTGNKYSQPVSGAIFNEVSPTFSGNLSAGGGSFKLGSQTLELNYVVCVNASDTKEFSEAFDGLFTLTPNFSMLFGLVGDLQSGSPEYMIIAFAAGQKAEGKFDVIDESKKDMSTGNFAFVSVFDFKDGAKNPKMYLSKDGTIDIKGGNITFDKMKMMDKLSSKEIDASAKFTCE